MPTTVLAESFDGVTAPALPTTFTYSASSFVTSTTTTYSAPNALNNTTSATVVAQTTSQDGNGGSAQVSARWNMSAAGTSQVILCVRGTNTQIPFSGATNYNVRTLNGTSLTLSKRVAGANTTLVTVSATFTSNSWYWVQITANGSAISCRVRRESDSFWLSSAGTWQSAQATAISITDTAVSGVGYAAIATSAATSYFDDFLFQSLATSAAPAPLVARSITLPFRGAALVGSILRVAPPPPSGPRPQQLLSARSTRPVPVRGLAIVGRIVKSVPAAPVLAVPRAPLIANPAVHRVLRPWTGRAFVGRLPRGALSPVLRTARQPIVTRGTHRSRSGRAFIGRLPRGVLGVLNPARVTQVAIEASALTTNALRVTQTALEAATLPANALRVTQTALEAATLPANAIRATQVVLEVSIISFGDTPPGTIIPPDGNGIDPLLPTGGCCPGLWSQVPIICSAWTTQANPATSWVAGACPVTTWTKETC